MVLSSASPFFKSLLLENPCRHPIVILPSSIDLRDLETIVQFVYGGEVEVPEARLDSVLRAAEHLQVWVGKNKSFNSDFLRRFSSQLSEVNSS